MKVRTALTAVMIAFSTAALAGAGGGGAGGGGGGAGGGSGGGAGAGSGAATGGATGSGVGTGTSNPATLRAPGQLRDPGVPAREFAPSRQPGSTRDAAPGAVNRPESQIDRDVDGRADSMDNDTGRRR